jgi:hypothetical protein
MERAAFASLGIGAAVAAFCSLSSALALSPGVPECLRLGETRMMDPVTLPCGNPAVPDASVAYCIDEVQTDNQQIVSVFGKDNYSYQVNVGNPNYTPGVTFTAVSTGTATISWQQTNWPTIPDRPHGPLGQINVVAGSCPGGPPPPPTQREITGTATPAALDIYPDDAFPFEQTVTTTWTVPAGFGATTLRFTTPSLISSTGIYPSLIPDGHTTSADIAYFISPSVVVRNPVATEFVFTATSANGHSKELHVQVRIEANRPPAMMQTGGDVMNGMIDFGNVWPGHAANRFLSLANQGPPLSRFRGPIWSSRAGTVAQPLPFTALSALAFNAMGGPANAAKCLPNVDLFGSERCEYTLQFKPTMSSGRTTVTFTFGGWSDPSTTPGNGVPIGLVGETPDAEIIQIVQIPLRSATSRPTSDLATIIGLTQIPLR